LPTITTLQQKQNNTRLEYVFLFLSNILEMLHLPIFTEFTEGHQYRGTNGTAGTGLLPYIAH